MRVNKGSLGAGSRSGALTTTIAGPWLDRKPSKHPVINTPSTRSAAITHGFLSNRFMVNKVTPGKGEGCGEKGSYVIRDA